VDIADSLQHIMPSDFARQLIDINMPKKTSRFHLASWNRSCGVSMKDILVFFLVVVHNPVGI
jgi:hypothetical protein